MTALEAMTAELRAVQREQVSCINKAGYVLPEHKHRYQELVRQAKEYQQAINYLKTIKEVSSCPVSVIQ